MRRVVDVWKENDADLCCDVVQRWLIKACMHQKIMGAFNGRSWCISFARVELSKKTLRASSLSKSRLHL